jgi:hypothetical protein
LSRPEIASSSHWTSARQNVVKCSAELLLTSCSRRSGTGPHGTAPDDMGRHLSWDPCLTAATLGSGVPVCPGFSGSTAGTQGKSERHV